MTDNITDNEIIKALERCVKTEFISDCAKCEMFAFDCKDTLIEEALDLINRQKAEIERLQNALMGECMLSACSREKEIKSEAIQEFAERFMREAGSRLNGFKYEYIIRDDIFDNLVKEMKEENENDFRIKEM